MSDGLLTSRLLVLGLGILAAGCGSGASTGGVMPPPGAPTLTDVQAQVFTPRCALSGCHVEPGAQLGLNLAPGSTAASTIGVASAEVPSLMRVEPFNADDSYVYMKLIGDPRILGDPMPLTGGSLGAGDLALVQTWIDQGAM